LDEYRHLSIPAELRKLLDQIEAKECEKPNKRSSGGNGATDFLRIEALISRESEKEQNDSTEPHANSLG
jgi:hypothetical protein